MSEVSPNWSVILPALTGLVGLVAGKGADLLSSKRQNMYERVHQLEKDRDGDRDKLLAQQDKFHKELLGQQKEHQEAVKQLKISHHKEMMAVRDKHTKTIERMNKTIQELRADVARLEGELHGRS